MKSYIRKTLILVSAFVLAANFAMGQKTIKGTVYMEGKPAAGITVEVHKGGDMLTSFDGKYELEADEKSKWIKFTFIDESKKIDLPENFGEVFDFAFDGVEPTNTGEEAGGVSMKTQEELIKEENVDYTNLISLYTTFYNQDDYESALPHWKKIYENYPNSSENVYIRGIKMYQSFIRNTSDLDEKNKLIDELMKIYDKRTEFFDDRGYVLGRKAVDWLEFKVRDQDLDLEEQKNALKSGYEWLNGSVDLQGDKSEAPILVLLMQTSSGLFKMGEISKETVVTNYEKCNTIINNVLNANADADHVARIQESQGPIEQIFGTSGAADCEALVNIYRPQFEEKSDDIEFIETMLRRLGNADCDESDLFAEASEKLYELRPSASAAYNMARRYVGKRDIEQAKKYYQEAMDQAEDNDLLSTIYLQYATLLYSQNSYSDARNYARKSLDAKENCQAYMLIAHIYASASQSYDGTDLEQRAVFWLVDDYLRKARRFEDCSIEASQEIAEYGRHFPNKEDAFMEGLQEGQTYRVAGWINESTTVRF